MRTVVYFPELRLGDHVVPSHSATSENQRAERWNSATTSEAFRTESAAELWPPRRRPVIRPCVIEA